MADVLRRCRARPRPRRLQRLYHVGRPPRLRRFYLFALFDADPGAATSWKPGALYALPRDGFRHEWVNAGPVRPVLRVLVEPEDFPLREVVVEAAIEEGIRGLRRRLRSASRRRTAGDE